MNFKTIMMLIKIPISIGNMILMLYYTHILLISKRPQPICDMCHKALTIKNKVEECIQYTK